MAAPWMMGFPSVISLPEKSRPSVKLKLEICYFTVEEVVKEYRLTTSYKIWRIEERNRREESKGMIKMNSIGPLSYVEKVHSFRSIKTFFGSLKLKKKIKPLNDSDSIRKCIRRLNECVEVIKNEKKFRAYLIFLGISKEEEKGKNFFSLLKSDGFASGGSMSKKSQRDFKRSVCDWDAMEFVLWIENRVGIPKESKFYQILTEGESVLKIFDEQCIDGEVLLENLNSFLEKVDKYYQKSFEDDNVEGRYSYYINRYKLAYELELFKRDTEVPGKDIDDVEFNGRESNTEYSFHKNLSSWGALDMIFLFRVAKIEEDFQMWFFKHLVFGKDLEKHKNFPQLYRYRSVHDQSIVVSDKNQNFFDSIMYYLKESDFVDGGDRKRWVEGIYKMKNKISERIVDVKPLKFLSARSFFGNVIYKDEIEDNSDFKLRLVVSNLKIFDRKYFNSKIKEELLPIFSQTKEEGINLGLIIGNYYVSWSENGIIFPVFFPENYVESKRNCGIFDVCLLNGNLEKIRECIRKIAMNYNLFHDYHSLKDNCHQFVDYCFEILGKSGLLSEINEKFSLYPIKKYFQSMKEENLNEFRFSPSVEFVDYFKLDKTYEIVFKNHKEIDTFISNNTILKDYVNEILEKKGCTIYKDLFGQVVLLIAFDRAFWVMWISRIGCKRELTKKISKLENDLEELKDHEEEDYFSAEKKFVEQEKSKLEKNMEDMEKDIERFASNNVDECIDCPLGGNPFFHQNFLL